MPKTTLLRKQVTPTGSIQPLAGDVIPDGYLQCDGSIVNIADYPKLHAVVGFAHGNGNNDGLTFHLPDLRGRFLRGLDNGAGRDPDAATRTAANAGGNAGDNVGSVQDDTVQGHGHIIRTGRNDSGSFHAAGGVVGHIGIAGASTYGDKADQLEDNGNGSPRSSSETRPGNANVNYIIKAV